ncbi:calcineurin-like phosphoesterase family protein [Anaerospora hongkongensis]|uniref:Calcineurin-like phosphoesterase family protein n=1 Tax=Anaerospora hongkongensis TaxID=244830 RepID=A0A4R1Q1I2_9FIRM|nr:metallophosphoesterase [Anaerospora hongkongensis]TCL39428.1 calcineurin-like phosphoesterase family protein [Anaerospora hongkongensis]
MKIFAIADTHLSGEPPTKPMDIFGAHWHNHWEKIKADWLDRVAAEDTVLLPGDISWAMRLDDALVDLNAIRQLPGRKILIRGNHVILSDECKYRYIA